MIFWICVVTIVVALTQYYRQLTARYRRHDIKYIAPIPLIGNSGRIMLRLDNAADDSNRFYTAFPKERFMVKFDFTKPTVLIRDLELVKRITVKDFEHFLDHREFINNDTDALFAKMIFSMKGQEWKDMRSALSPAFTSSKIRLMVPLMVEVGEQMIKALKNNIKNSEVEYIDVEAKDLMSRYANDVIASCAFGCKVDSYSDDQNEFYVMGKEATTVSFKKVLVFFCFLLIPKLIKKVTSFFISEEARYFFRSLVLNTMQDRKEHHIIRHDMINLFMEARKGQLSHDENVTIDADAGFATVQESAVGKRRVNRVWSDDDLVAQAIGFFFASFETISSGMSFLLHELALNPDVQEKLAQEIRENDVNNSGKIDYNSIQQMTYLDMVISELMRLWPSAIALDRICNKDYNLGRACDDATEDFIIRTGESVTIPLWGFHHDSEYFPDPLRFDPERFSEQNKHNIKPFSYMPFGLGPRNCIGSRFALCEMKVMAYQMLQSMVVSPAAMTQIPTELAKEAFSLRIKGGHWIRLTMRE